METIVSRARCVNIIFMETNLETAARIGELLGQLGERFTLEDADEQEFMRESLGREAQAALEHLNVSMLHLLGKIPAQLGEATNVVGIAERAGVAKSTVSKALPLLTRLELVQRYRLEGNRKEVHLRLTPLGEEIHDAHRRLHAEMTESFLDFLAQYQQADLEVVVRMLTDLLHAPRRGVRFQIE